MSYAIKQPLENGIQPHYDAFKTEEQAKTYISKVKERLQVIVDNNTIYPDSVREKAQKDLGEIELWVITEK